MSEPVRRPPPSNPAMLPLMGAVVGLAGIVALWGILSLVLDRNPIDYPDAGPLLGPTMVAAGAVVTWIVAWRVRRPWVAALLAFAGTFLAMLVVAGIGYGVTRGSLEWMLRAPAHFAIGPFVPGAAALCALVTLGVRVLR